MAILPMQQVEQAPSYEKGDPLTEVDEQLLERVKAEFLAVHGARLKRLRKNPEAAMQAGTKLVQAQVLGNAEDEDRFGTFAAVYTVPEARSSCLYFAQHCRCH